MEEILGYKNQYQSAMMKQGLKDEKSILSLYEKQLDCKVDDTGFLISWSHPFLGASPDGEVDGGLVEIKRIFPNGSTLSEAVCKRYICKGTTHGLAVNKNHKFYYQVQLQMFCAECNWADLVLSDMNDLMLYTSRSAMASPLASSQSWKPFIMSIYLLNWHIQE